MSDAAGPAGIELHPGDHVCGLYLGEAARDDLVLAFLRHGLASGDKCICIIEDANQQAVLARLEAEPGGRPHTLPGQFDLVTPQESYLKPVRFTSVDVLRFWTSWVTEALGGQKFAAARVTGDTTWILGAPESTFRDFMGYESELNRFVAEHAVSVLCLYDLEALGGGILVDLLKTHPKLLLGGMLLENPHALSPDEFLAR